MKKLLLASTIIFTTTLTPLSFNETKIEAKAKSEIYPLSNSFVTSLKNGQLRNSKVAIGMSAKKMKKVAALKSDSDGLTYSLKKPVASGAAADVISVTSKTKRVATISRVYNYTIGKSTVDKKLGKPYKVKK
ncbi:hypothetical protein [Kurthia sp. Dielmo]|uniref:hypothetical protein n=1 Tax=Kurthia sp. Dielmo TaxID=1033738 RepID=UPI0002EF9B09|nr:hypothetical protein [Kurthia sp. Dielmo]